MLVLSCRQFQKGLWIVHQFGELSDNCILIVQQHIYVVLAGVMQLCLKHKQVKRVCEETLNMFKDIPLSCLTGEFSRARKSC